MLNIVMIKMRLEKKMVCPLISMWLLQKYLVFHDVVHRQLHNLLTRCSAVSRASTRLVGRVWNGTSTRQRIEPDDREEPAASSSNGTDSNKDIHVDWGFKYGVPPRTVDQQPSENGSVIDWLMDVIGAGECREIDRQARWDATTPHKTIDQGIEAVSMASSPNDTESPEANAIY